MSDSMAQSAQQPMREIRYLRDHTHVKIASVKAWLIAADCVAVPREVFDQLTDGHENVATFELRDSGPAPGTAESLNALPAGEYAVIRLKGEG